MSTQIGQERSAYYDTFETTQKGGLDVTAWVNWFLNCLERAFDGAENIPKALFQNRADLGGVRRLVASCTHDKHAQEVSDSHRMDVAPRRRCT
jgi:Uncharacterized conserved protein